MVGSPFAEAKKLAPIFGNVISILWVENMGGLYKYVVFHFEEANQEIFQYKEFREVNTVKMSTQAQAPTPFREESTNSQYDDPLRLIMQELQSLRDEMRDIRRDVTNLSNQQREFHHPPHFDEELHPPPYGGRRGSFGGRGMPRHFEEWKFLPKTSHYIKLVPYHRILNGGSSSSKK
ncbi:hypothetical protein M9H77_16710 [Catharanthus roseus]|uniref:Uncharacterized protein n=1 Tax=Catharanthus roseus TaxID=4058 RepID=A0ACC0B2J3_CATRO|nr:hypothetical protein M9H77_16710 [Catharanthus roseus]